MWMSNLKEGLQNIEGGNVAKTQMNKLKQTKKPLLYVDVKYQGALVKHRERKCCKSTNEQINNEFKSIIIRLIHIICFNSSNEQLYFTNKCH